MVEIIVEVANLNKLMKDNQEDMFSEYKSRYFTATNTEKKNAVPIPLRSAHQVNMNSVMGLPCNFLMHLSVN